MRQIAEDIAKIRSANKEGVLASSRPLSPKYQELGVLGELGAAEKLRVLIDDEQRMRGDGGKDLHFRGYSIDVKTARKAYYLFVEQGTVISDIYVLCQFYTDRLEYLGWAFKSEIIKAPIRSFGYPILNHYLPVERLHLMDTLFQLPSKY